MDVDKSFRIAIHVIKANNYWVVLKTGAKRALFKDTDKEKCIDYAKQIGKEDSLRIFIHGITMDIQKVLPPNEKPLKVSIQDVSKRKVPKSDRTKEIRLIGGNI